MIYDYICDACQLEDEVIQSITEYTGSWTCPSCGNAGRRNYKYCNFVFTGTKIEDAEFNPGLGIVTKSEKHRNEVAKQLGAVEIGNENPDKLHKAFDDERARKIKKSWDEV